MDQSISLQMRRNVEISRKLADIVVQPDLEKYPGSEFAKISEIIKLGAEAAERQLPDLKALLADVPEYDRPPLPSLPVPPVILSVSFEGLREVPSAQLRPEITVHPGQSLDVAKIERDLRRLYAGGLFERVDFKLLPAGDNSFHLVYVVRETTMRTLGASIRYDRDYGFVALAELNARQLFHTPSTLTLSTQFGGLEDYIASLHYVPSYRNASFYVAPAAHYSTREYPQYIDGDLVDHFTYKRVGGQLMIGTLFKRTRIEAGYRVDRASTAGGILPFTQAGSLVLRGMRLNLVRNTTDARRFPSQGTLWGARADFRPESLGSEAGYTKAEVDFIHFIPLRERINVQLFGSGGITQGAVPFYEHFFAGGFNFSEDGPRRLLGFDFAELTARQILVAGGAYRYRFFDQPIGFMKRAFVSGTYNAAWISDADHKPYHAKLYNGIGAELALETLAGPVRLAIGWGQGGRFNVYISLGPSF
jgi:outer membrane protein assembly factor BamA